MVVGLVLENLFCVINSFQNMIVIILNIILGNENAGFGHGTTQLAFLCIFSIVYKGICSFKIQLCLFDFRRVVGKKKTHVCKSYGKQQVIIIYRDSLSSCNIEKVFGLGIVTVKNAGVCSFNRILAGILNCGYGHLAFRTGRTGSRKNQK